MSSVGGTLDKLAALTSIRRTRQGRAEFERKNGEPGVLEARMAQAAAELRALADDLEREVCGR